jgi:hypothetical protein
MGDGGSAIGERKTGAFGSVATTVVASPAVALSVSGDSGARGCMDCASGSPPVLMAAFEVSRHGAKAQRNAKKAGRRILFLLGESLRFGDLARYHSPPARRALKVTLGSCAAVFDALAARFISEIREEFSAARLFIGGRWRICLQSSQLVRRTRGGAANAASSKRKHMRTSRE